MSRFLSRDSMVSIALYQAASLILAPCVGHSHKRTGKQGHLISVGQISFWILPIVQYCSQSGWLSKKLIKWVLSNAQVTCTICTPAGSWFCVSHNYLSEFILLYIRHLFKSARNTYSESRCVSDVRSGKKNKIHLKVSLQYNVLKRCE